MGEGRGKEAEGIDREGTKEEEGGKRKREGGGGGGRKEENEGGGKGGREITESVSENSGDFNAFVECESPFEQIFFFIYIRDTQCVCVCVADCITYIALH